MSLPKPYYQDKHCTIFHADCREILPLLEPVDLVLTDPPYGVKIADWDGIVPHDLLGEFLKASTGAVVWFGAAPQHRNDMCIFAPPPERVLIWHPRFTLSKTMAHGMAYRWHPIYCWNLPKKHTGPRWDVLGHNTECGNDWNHPCTKPLKLITALAGFCVGSTILDPFMGSGTTLRAAKDLGKKAIGIDICEAYCEIAATRLQQEVFDFGAA